MSNQNKKLTLTEINSRLKFADKQKSFTEINEIVRRNLRLTEALFDFYVFENDLSDLEYLIVEEDSDEDVEIEVTDTIFLIENYRTSLDTFPFRLDNVEYKDSQTNSDEFWLVLYFKEEDIYIKFYGSYDSYGNSNHSYYTSTSIVTPKEVTMTIYE